MEFNELIRIADHQPRADQSAVGAIIPYSLSPGEGAAPTGVRIILLKVINECGATLVAPHKVVMHLLHL